MPGNAAVFWRMARTSFRTADFTSAAARGLVYSEGFRVPLYLYLGARDVAAFPLRPTDGLRLEVPAAAGPGKSGGNGNRRGLVAERHFSLPRSQFSVALDGLRDRPCNRFTEN